MNALSVPHSEKGWVARTLSLSRGPGYHSELFCLAVNPRAASPPEVPHSSPSGRSTKRLRHVYRGNICSSFKDRSVLTPLPLASLMPGQRCSGDGDWSAPPGERRSRDASGKLPPI